jgi:hypothetical protein
MLTSVHNLHYYLNLMREVREALARADLALENKLALIELPGLFTRLRAVSIRDSISVLLSKPSTPKY